ncbi:hypothetical protein C1752_02751 [Acaryochloris thomasi RCC1774]|uniref:MrfA-like Zn-binding domain-containing protein n=1 Tax=Acaryochloris thomasi RCC1774 TaxID=1764569 RepID=A0A2W1JH95_9CYAN|nr:DUF1998 domain-containing protein [Acaryochloris thomasi]PZD72940.1 hypothetical protein C1752_02751 [Acaryochloris thomasi RCC1774]
MNTERYKVGELRPSQIMFSFGIGAVVDLPNLSVMVMGLNEWDTALSDPLAEERLLAAVCEKLGSQVQKLIPPPVPLSDPRGAISPLGQAAKVGIPVSPFPGWGVCQACRLLAPFSSSMFTLKNDLYRPDKTRYIHGNCTKSGKYPPTVIPARFLVACSQGHLDDFPWLYFIHRGQGECPGRLRLEEAGISGSAADVIVKCDRCGASRSMAAAFGNTGQQNMPQCRARHPHLRNFHDDGCSEQMKSILLGASNSWFPVTLPVLSIPGTSNSLGQLVETHWATLKEISDASQVDLLRRIGQLKAFSQYSDIDLWQEIQRQQSPNPAQSEDVRNLKLPEWEVLSNANPDLNTANFRLKPEGPPTGYGTYFTKTVLVERLREVRALIGFTRIESPGDLSDIGDINDVTLAPLSRELPKWVPASDIRGEGIFLQFREDAIANWIERYPALEAYEEQSHMAHTQWRCARNIDNPAENFPELRYMLLHSFAHALMRQMAIECGYAAASLRERIYSSRRGDDVLMAGILIYTASPDSEGTLGGLVGLGKPVVLGRHIDQALEQIGLCASDPLCAEHESLQDGTLHGSACHACLFSPETSCERGNKYLDRALLVTMVNQTTENFAFFQPE